MVYPAPYKKRGETAMVEQNKISIDVMKTSATWIVARIAIFSALTVVGSFIKTPSPIPSVAFDSTPGFFAALYFGALDGALVCGIGHIVTAVMSGFPLGIYHIPIAIGMALAGVAMALLNRLNKKWGFIPAIIVGVAINTASVVFAVPVITWAGALAFAPTLLFGASLNAVVSALIYVAIRGKLRF
jgi:riboflavin transporter